VSSRGGQFGGYGGQPNMAQLMKQAQKMQADLAAAQNQIAQTEFVGTAGGGLVSVQLLGSGEVSAVTISPAAVDADDVETLQDLIVAAVRDARRQLEELTEVTMAPFAGAGLGDLGGLGLPGR
jgi:DNA-binding YbaB/EbfC family protein